MIHLIGNAHIDPVWLWNKSEGLAEIRATFRSALERMKEFPEYHFTSACAYYYAWIEAVDPPMLREIQQRVKEGRWHIAGGMWVQPDNNIPSGESLVRHFLYSQRTFERLFGQIARVGYLVDSFGHNGMTPQLLKKAGMDYFVFQRPDLTEKDWETELFQWESPDGSRVLSYRMPKPYGEQCGGVLADELIDEKLTMGRDLSAETGRPQMCFYGVGNHGGGPTVHTLKLLRERNEAGDLHHTSMEEFFASVEEIPDLPVYRIPLLHHASGCYSAHAALKAANAHAENALRVAEIYDTLCAKRLGVSAQTNRLREAWETVMFNQFHDILAGCSIREACEQALDGYCAACHAAEEIGEIARQRIAANLCTTRDPDETGVCEKLEMRRLWAKNGEGAPAVVFNPHPFPVRALVSLNTLLPVNSVRGLNGNLLPVQKFRGQHTLFAEKDSTMFQVEVPAFGHTVVYLYYDALEGELMTKLTCTDSSLENPYLRVSFDKKTGWISDFYDKVNGRELAAGAMTRAVAIENGEADTWAHRIFTFDQECGEFTLVSMQLLENGPLRGCIRVRSRYGDSVLVQDYSLTADSRRIEVNCTLELHDVQKFVKLVFPAAIAAPEAVYAMPFGYRTHSMDGMEQPASEWAGLWDQVSHQGLAIACCGKYSYSASGDELRVTIARSAYYADHDGERDELMDVLDEGKQTFRYAIMPLDGDPTPVVQQLAIMHHPLDVVYESHHDGDLPAEYTGIIVSQANVSVSACKYGEDGSGFVLRVWETAGVATTATVYLDGFAPLSVSLAPQEVQTFQCGSAGWQAVDLLEKQCKEEI